jgi:AraC-like DNA-binding protein
VDDPRQQAVSALSETSRRVRPRSLLVSWGARALYVGPAFGLSAHRNAVAVLAIGLHGPLGVARDARKTHLGFFTCRTALIEPNQQHLIQTTDEDVALLYVDALSNDLTALRSRCLRRGPAASFDIDTEDALIALLAGMERSAEGWRTTSDRVAEVLSLHRARPDARIEAAVRSLLAAPGQEMDAAGLAFQIGLSSSRFQHLFKEVTGVSFRRFRVWARIRAALAGAMRGATLTQAAYEAGFSSSAHLSCAFKEMFGMAPTRLLAGAPLLVESA